MNVSEQTELDVTESSAGSSIVIGNQEEVVTTGNVTVDQSLGGTSEQLVDPIDATTDTTITQLTSGKLTSLNIHISLIIAFDNQIK